MQITSQMERLVYGQQCCLLYPNQPEGYPDFHIQLNTIEYQVANNSINFQEKSRKAFLAKSEEELDYIYPSVVHLYRRTRLQPFEACMFHRRVNNSEEKSRQTITSTVCFKVVELLLLGILLLPAVSILRKHLQITMNTLNNNSTFGILTDSSEITFMSRGYSSSSI